MNDLQQCQKKLTAYVERRLLTRLGLSARPFALEPVHAGIHSRVFFLNVDKGPQLVLKVISKRRRLRSVAAGAQHLAGRGIATPGIIFADADSRLFNRRGMHVLCEERIVGDSLEKLPRTPELISKVAKLYAAMHAVKRSTWGDIKRGKTTGLAEYLQKKLVERLDGWGRSEELAPGLRKKILDRFSQGKAALDSIKNFSLSHTDPNRNNLILRQSDRKLFLLDAGSLRYLPRAVDYFMLQAYFCFDNPALAELFEQTYFSAVAQTELDEFRATQEVFRLYVIVLFVHDLTTRFAGLDRKSPYYDEFAGLIPRAKSALMELLEAK